MGSRCAWCWSSCCDDGIAARYAGVACGGRGGHAPGFRWAAALVQKQLLADPFSGQLFVFRGRRGDHIKVLWWDGDGMSLFAKRLERGHFVWPQARAGKVALTPAQLSMLLEGIDWRRPVRTAPVRAV